jgi:hypothetical protein
VIKRRNVIIGIAAVVALLLGATHLQRVQAASAADQNDFEVQPVLPDSQVDMSKNYFDLQARANGTQKIQMRVQNFTAKTITVQSNLRNAYTQDGGGIDFAPKNVAVDSTLKIPLTSIAKLDRGDETLKLGPHGVRVINVTIKYPKKQFGGMIYGDWHFLEKVNKNLKKKTAVHANYAYSIGVVLRGNRFDEIGPEMHYVGTNPFLYNKHPALGITLRNSKAMPLRAATVQASVAREGDSGLTRTYNASGFLIAPNSTMRLPISWNYDSMKPGTYLIKVKLQGQNYVTHFPMTWTFKKKFRVATHKVQSLNEQAVKKPVNKWTYTAVGVGILWIAAIGIWAWVLKLRPQ